MLSKVIRYLGNNVLGLLALFVALGGTAYAVDSVNSADIIDGGVKSVDVGDGEINSADVKDSSLNTFDVQSFLGADVVDNTLTGSDVDESTLNLAAEPWHEVGAPGQPGFKTGNFCVWSNYDSVHNTAAFLRDRSGFVHLKGVVDADDGPGGVCGTGGLETTIFSLPSGYRPAKQELISTLTNGAPGQVGISADQVKIESPTTFASAKSWISLDGFSFRCAPSGQNGCP